MLRRHPAVMAELALECHLRHCRACRRAQQRRVTLCAAGRQLLQAVLTASAALSGA